ncbi:MAG: Tex family protein [Syntrophomonadaceae bacterium]|nr:Tex family protein [Syntrophomonadaceae bacterium]MDD3271491.1 Tex family protein [Syntrophomonadaceae bacterium]MDD3898808.1 Tex family protein [Syntrophomonadaceae bacterium]MDD4562729.1 Tex family protein [Syntrophomonadaceae bacterium]
MEQIFNRILEETHISLRQIRAVVQLLDDKNTVPFIARYRKEATGGLDENEIRLIEERLNFHRNLEQRKEEVIRLIEEQGKLTAELETRIRQAGKLVEIDDIYLPFRPKRKTRASTARARGLQPLADFLLACPRQGKPEEEASRYLSDEVTSIEVALQGAMDIVAEQVSEDASARGWIREYSRKNGILVVAAKDKNVESPYRMYYEYQEAVSKIPPHRILAINRGEREEILKVSVSLETDKIIDYLSRRYVKPGVTAEYLTKAIQDSYSRLIKPSIERDLRNELSEKAEEQAITVFAKNLHSLLMQPPVKGQIILGLDPAYRTGCKWTIVDDTGKMLEVGVVYPTPPQKKVTEAEEILNRQIKKYGVTAIAIGNGTASRETEQFVAEMIKNKQLQIPYTIVSEAGASVYSASPLAAQEFPQLDVAQRSAVSIARRLQDPLAELVKIEPRAIGVGQYQHDLPPKELDQNLTTVVESAVNQVGVELNTASASLLTYVSGLTSTVANKVVEYRDQNGKFKNRKELLKVSKLGPKTFQQAAGFLRIYQADNPLDSTAIHPESYQLASGILGIAGASLEEIGTPALATKLGALKPATLAHNLEAGEPTVKDVISCLLKPHRDPREDLPPVVFRTDVLSIEDITPGMSLTGTVRNVVDFGAFVDIGIKNDGLVHISQMADRYIRHPMEVVAVGDVVTVQVLSVDRERGKVSLSMKTG